MVYILVYIVFTTLEKTFELIRCLKSNQLKGLKKIKVCMCLQKNVQ